ncbi:unnamed protein product [Paramecium octaurelia]|uniref:Uncharacterized protein n=1 Tax=Paramecium octaurelia TaxID=43137 RepID=A0A8S1X0J4_PAROT|nr:unnamed protein product [Paramecium octaurelia]
MYTQIIEKAGRNSAFLAFMNLLKKKIRLCIRRMIQHYQMAQTYSQYLGMVKKQSI